MQHLLSSFGEVVGGKSDPCHRDRCFHAVFPNGSQYGKQKPLAADLTVPHPADTAKACSWTEAVKPILMQDPVKVLYRENSGQWAVGSVFRHIFIPGDGGPPPWRFVVKMRDG